ATRRGSVRSSRSRVRCGSSFGRLEHRGPVVAQLGYRLTDVVERAMRLLLPRAAAVDLRVPPTTELLQRRDVDAAVVQVLVELRKSAIEEAPVDTDAVAAERCLSRVTNVTLDVLEHARTRGREIDGRCSDLREQ